MPARRFGLAQTSPAGSGRESSVAAMTAEAVPLAQHDHDHRHAHLPAITNRREKWRTVTRLRVGADHESWCVTKRNHRKTERIAPLQEPGELVGAVRIDSAADSGTAGRVAGSCRSCGG